MYQQEEKEAEEAYEEPRDDEFVDEAENMWAIMNSKMKIMRIVTLKKSKWNGIGQ